MNSSVQRESDGFKGQKKLLFLSCAPTSPGEETYDAKPPTKVKRKN